MSNVDKSVDCVYCGIARMCFVTVSLGLKDFGLCSEDLFYPDWNARKDKKWRESRCEHVVQMVIQRIYDVLVVPVE